MLGPRRGRAAGGPQGGPAEIADRIFRPQPGGLLLLLWGILRSKCTCMGTKFDEFEMVKYFF